MRRGGGIILSAALIFLLFLPEVYKYWGKE